MGVASQIERSVAAYGVIREGLFAYHSEPAFIAVTPACDDLLALLPRATADLQRNQALLDDGFAVAVLVFGIQRPIMAASPEHLEAIEAFLVDAWRPKRLPKVEDVRFIKELVDTGMEGSQPYVWHGIRSFLASTPGLPRPVAALALGAVYRFCTSPWVRPFLRGAPEDYGDLTSSNLNNPEDQDHVTNDTLIQVVSSAVKVALDAVAQPPRAVSEKSALLSESKPSKRFKPNLELKLVPKGFPNVDGLVESSWKSYQARYAPPHENRLPSSLYRRRRQHILPIVILLVTGTMLSILVFETVYASSQKRAAVSKVTSSLGRTLLKSAPFLPKQEQEEE